MDAAATPQPKVGAEAGVSLGGGFDATQGARLTGTPSDVDLGTLSIGQAPRSAAVVIMNIGNAESGALTATLQSGPELRLTTNCMGRRLRSGETCVVTVEFEAASVGLKMASGMVSDGASAPVTFTARATGRLGADAGPDVARPPSDAAGAETAGLRDAAAETPARDVAAPVDASPPDAGGAADAAADGRG